MLIVLLTLLAIIKRPVNCSCRQQSTLIIESNYPNLHLIDLWIKSEVGKLAILIHDIHIFSHDSIIH